jgi:hypothetical protein
VVKATPDKKAETPVAVGVAPKATPEQEEKKSNGAHTPV